MKVELRHAIDQWLEKRGNTLTKLSKKAGLGYSTVRRIMQNEQIPTLRTQMQIGFVVFKPEKCCEVFKNDIPNYLTPFTVGPGVTNDNSQVLDGLLLDDLSHAIVSLAMRGTTREEIKEEHGRHGLESLDALLAMNALEEKDGVVSAEDVDINAVGDLCKAIQLSALQISPQNYTAGCWWSEGWSVKGITALAALCSEFMSRIAEMRRNVEYRGGISATIGMFMFRRGTKWL